MTARASECPRMQMDDRNAQKGSRMVDMSSTVLGWILVWAQRLSR